MHAGDVAAQRGQLLRGLVREAGGAQVQAALVGQDGLALVGELGQQRRQHRLDRVGRHLDLHRQTLHEAGGLQPVDELERILLVQAHPVLHQIGAQARRLRLAEQALQEGARRLSGRPARGVIGARRGRVQVELAGERVVIHGRGHRQTSRQESRFGNSAVRGSDRSAAAAPRSAPRHRRAGGHRPRRSAQSPRARRAGGRSRRSSGWRAHPSASRR